MLLRSLATLIVGALCCMTASGGAQDVEANLEADFEAGDPEAPGTADTDARALFEAGLIAYNDARFRVALENFQAAYELSARPQLLFNIGLAQERLGDDEAALQSFQTYLSAATEGTNRLEVERRVAVIRGRLEPAADEPAQLAEPPNRTPGWIVLASGLALSVGGAVSLGVGLSKRASVTGSANGELEWPDAEARFDRGSGLMVGGAVALGIGVAAAAVSVALLRGNRGTTVSTNGSMIFVS